MDLHSRIIRCKRGDGDDDVVVEVDYDFVCVDYVVVDDDDISWMKM